LADVLAETEIELISLKNKTNVKMFYASRYDEKKAKNSELSTATLNNGNNNSFAESNLPLTRKRQITGEGLSTSPNKFPKRSSLVVKQCDNMPKPKFTRNKLKYVQHDLTQDLLSGLRMCPLNGHTWLWN
ncbi:2094_t:CDS:2, partial [Funneliformis caledonium]